MDFRNLTGRLWRGLNLGDCCFHLTFDLFERKSMLRLIGFNSSKLMRPLEQKSNFPSQSRTSKKSVFQSIMLKHKHLVAEFLTANYDEFFRRYGLLLHTTNYATLRQSLKLLSELLLGRNHRFCHVTAPGD